MGMFTVSSSQVYTYSLSSPSSPPPSLPPSLPCSYKLHVRHGHVVAFDARDDHRQGQGEQEEGEQDQQPLGPVERGGGRVGGREGGESEKREKRPIR